MPPYNTGIAFTTAMVVHHGLVNTVYAIGILVENIRPGLMSFAKTHISAFNSDAIREHPTTQRLLALWIMGNASTRLLAICMQHRASFLAIAANYAFEAIAVGVLAVHGDISWTRACLTAAISTFIGQFCILCFYAKSRIDYTRVQDLFRMDFTLNTHTTATESD